MVVFSDLLCDREPLFKGLEMLRHRRHDVMVFHVLDDDELTFPFGGMTKFEGLEELPHLLCDPRALRDGYLEALEEYLTEVRRGCTRIGVDYTPGPDQRLPGRGAVAVPVPADGRPRATPVQAVEASSRASRSLVGVVP